MTAATEVAPTRARILRELLEHAGWKVTKLLNVIEPVGSEDTEVIFLGQQAGTRTGGAPDAVHTALIPQSEHGEITVLDRVL